MDGGGEGLREGERGRFLNDVAEASLVEGPACLDGAMTEREPAGLLAEGVDFPAGGFPFAGFESTPLTLSFSAGRPIDLTETETPEPLLSAGALGLETADA